MNTLETQFINSFNDEIKHYDESIWEFGYENVEELESYSGDNSNTRVLELKNLWAEIKFSVTVDNWGEREIDAVLDLINNDVEIDYTAGEVTILFNSLDYTITYESQDLEEFEVFSDKLKNKIWEDYNSNIVLPAYFNDLEIEELATTLQELQ